MADALDVLTLDEARAILDVGAFDDTETTNLTRLITAVSRRLDRGVGPIVKRTITNELLSSDVYGTAVWLRSFPVVSVSQVIETLDTVPTTLTPTDYTLVPYGNGTDLFSGQLLRRSGTFVIAWATGLANISVTYSAGRYNTTTAVDPLFKEAAALMLRNAWRSTEISVGQDGEYDVPISAFPTFAVPKVVKELLAHEWQDFPGIA